MKIFLKKINKHNYFPAFVLVLSLGLMWILIKTGLLMMPVAFIDSQIYQHTQEIPSEKASVSRISNETDCMSSRGSWVRAWPTDNFYCNYEYPDSGKSCRSGFQCLSGFCKASNEGLFNAGECISGPPSCSNTLVFGLPNTFSHVCN